MANMSYCRFENTFAALRDCVWELDDAMSIESMDLSISERTAMFAMVELCERYIEGVKTLMPEEFEQE